MPESRRDQGDQGSQEDGHSHGDDGCQEHDEHGEGDGGRRDRGAEEVLR